MVVNGKKIFFEYHPFEKRGGVNPMGGVFFEKSLARSPFRYAPPRPRTPAPAPQRGGGRQRIAVQNIYTTICGSPSQWSKPKPISLNKD